MIVEMDETNGGRHSKIGMNFMAIPAGAIATVARVLEEGAVSHNDPDGQNWRKIPLETHLNHVYFHLNAYQRGVIGEDHLAHALTRMVMAWAVENGD